MICAIRHREKGYVSGVEEGWQAYTVYVKKDGDLQWRTNIKIFNDKRRRSMRVRGTGRRRE
jgi:hypothetical protein